MKYSDCFYLFLAALLVMFMSPPLTVARNVIGLSFEQEFHGWRTSLDNYRVVGMVQTNGTNIVYSSNDTDYMISSCRPDASCSKSYGTGSITSAIVFEGTLYTFGLLHGDTVIRRHSDNNTFTLPVQGAPIHAEVVESTPLVILTLEREGGCVLARLSLVDYFVSILRETYMSSCSSSFLSSGRVTVSSKDGRVSRYIIPEGHTDLQFATHTPGMTTMKSVTNAIVKHYRGRHFLVTTRQGSVVMMEFDDHGVVLVDKIQVAYVDGVVIRDVTFTPTHLFVVGSINHEAVIVYFNLNVRDSGYYAMLQDNTVSMQFIAAYSDYNTSSKLVVAGEVELMDGRRDALVVTLTIRPGI